MSTIVLEFTPGVNNTVRLNVRGGNGVVGGPYDLAAPYLAPNLVDALQGGSPTASERALIEDAVTTWLLGAHAQGAAGNGLRQHLLSLLNPPPALGPAVNAEVSFVYDRDLSGSILPLPLEMTRLQIDTLALFGRVRAVAHVLTSADTATQRAAADWPLRILLFRSSPRGLDAVPYLAPIVGQLNAQIAQAADRLRIREVTSEAAGAPAATFARLAQEIKVFRPHVAVFLGHGVIDGRKSYLAFEGQQSQYVPVEAADFRIMLQNGAADLGVPLLVLVGCLTAGAAQAPADPALAAVGGAPTPSRPLAFLGFAQEVIQSSLGVTVSIGMRARIDADEAKQFIVDLFEGLTSGASPGDIGAAVKHARVQLASANPGTLGPWIPMVMQAKDQPSPLAFLSRPYTKPALVVDQGLLARRRAIWAGLFDAAVAKLAMPRLEDLRIQYEVDVATSAHGNPMLQPAFSQHAGTEPVLQLQLTGQLDTEMIELVLSLPTGATVRALRRSGSTAAAGFRLLRGDNVPDTIELVLQSDHETTLPAGTLLELDLTFSPGLPTVREFAVTVTNTKPARAVLGEINVLIQTA